MALPARADLFDVSITVNGVTQTRSFSSLENALTLLTGPGITSLFPSYRTGTALTSVVNYGGLVLPITVPAGTTTAVLTIPGTNTGVAFAGQTSGQTQNLLRNFFQGAVTSGDVIASLPESVRATLSPDVQNALRASLTTVLQTAVATTISDPVAGNPSALMPQMVAADYLAGMAPSGSLLGVNEARAGGFHFSGGLNILATSSGGADTRVLSAPLRVSYYIPRTATEIFLDAPMSYADIGGTSVFQGSVGIGVRQRVWHGERFEWNLTPAYRTGIAGSESYGRGSLALGVSLTSDLRFSLPADYTFAITNTAAYYQTEAYNFGGFNINYNLQNQYYRNGVTLSRPLGEVFGRPLQGGLTFVDTRVTGDRTAVPGWQEYGVVLATGGRLPSRFTATFINGQNNFQAFRFGLSTAF